jgi:hypothetical protein
LLLGISLLITAGWDQKAADLRGLILNEGQRSLSLIGTLGAQGHVKIRSGLVSWEARSLVKEWGAEVKPLQGGADVQGETETGPCCPCERVRDRVGAQRLSRSLEAPRASCIRIPRESPLCLKITPSLYMLFWNQYSFPLNVFVESTLMPSICVSQPKQALHTVQLKKQAKDLHRHFPKEDTQIASEHMKRYLHHLSLGKCK